MYKKSSIENVLLDNKHRPFAMPQSPWKYYQEWHDVIFAHWNVAVPSLRALIPSALELDLFEGNAWVSLVAFTIKHLRPRYIPSLKALSDFYEVNLRTYVIRNGKPGIYFLSIEAQKLASALMAKLVTGLPYIKSDIKRELNFYQSTNIRKGFEFSIHYEPLKGILEKNGLEKWLIERYCLFNELPGNIYSHDIHHREWPLQSLAVNSFDLHYQFKDLIINNAADLYHYSKGVQVPTWGKRSA
ncbi:MAG: YqjF family protein [Flavisolibacter sp.]